MEESTTLTATDVLKDSRIHLRGFGSKLARTLMGNTVGITCKKCGRPFKTQGGLLSHYAEKHERLEDANDAINNT